jgi:hypothetical protein
MSVCPACGETFTAAKGGRRAVWCSADCRRWVHECGGPALAADVLDGWARGWENAARTRGFMPSGAKRRAEAIAKRLRERATLLRQRAKVVPNGD